MYTHMYHQKNSKILEYTIEWKRALISRSKMISQDLEYVTRIAIITHPKVDNNYDLILVIYLVDDLQCMKICSYTPIIPEKAVIYLLLINYAQYEYLFRTHVKLNCKLDAERRTNTCWIIQLLYRNSMEMISLISCMDCPISQLVQL